MTFSASEIQCSYRPGPVRSGPSQTDYKTLPRIGLFRDPNFSETDPELIPLKPDIQNESKVVVSIPPFIEKPLWLYQADTFFPGWAVYIDGKLSGVDSANGCFRRVRLDRGARRVHFLYRPLSFCAGIFITVSTLLVLFTAASFSLKNIFALPQV